MSDEYEYDDNSSEWDDQGGLYVNFSDDEAASESRDMEPLPTGKYLVSITDVTMKESQSDKNPGKPMYSFEFTVVDDKRGGVFRERKTWALAMLWSPALFTITHIMKACDFPVNAGRVRIPAPGEFIGKVIMIGGILRGEQKDKNDPSKTYAARFEPKSFWPESKWKETPGTATAKTSAGGRSSLLS